MAAGKAKEGFLRPAQHGPELAAEDAVGAANDLLQHSFLNSFPSGTFTKIGRHVQGADSALTSRLRLIVVTLEELRHERNGPIV